MKKRCNYSYDCIFKHTNEDDCLVSHSCQYQSTLQDPPNPPTSGSNAVKRPPSINHNILYKVDTVGDIIVAIGWQCPICNKVMSPYVNACQNPKCISNKEGD